MYTTLYDYSKDFFVAEKCPIYKRREKKNKAPSKVYWKQLKGVTTKYIHSSLGEKLITEITAEEIDLYLITLKKQKNLSGVYINKTLIAFRHIFQEAVRDNLVEKNVMLNVKNMNKGSRTKGIFTAQEVQLLSNPDVWFDYSYYLLNKVAKYTGMRMGEIRALSHKDLSVSCGAYYLYVTKSINRFGEIVPTKTKINRIVPIPTFLGIELYKYHPGWNYWFSHSGDIPYTDLIIGKKFRKALAKIGIDNEERKQRNISFHSWRHRYVSLMRGHMSDEQLRIVIGHSSSKITNRYTQAIPFKAKKILKDPFFNKLYDS